jgi:hypothetical protein
MASNQIDRDDANGVSSFGAHGPQRPRTLQGLRRLKMPGAEAPAESARDIPGNDPYNSSGSFDRRKNWERVRKR